MCVAREKTAKTEFSKVYNCVPVYNGSTNIKLWRQIRSRQISDVEIPIWCGFNQSFESIVSILVCAQACRIRNAGVGIRFGLTTLISLRVDDSLIADIKIFDFGVGLELSWSRVRRNF